MGRLPLAWALLCAGAVLGAPVAAADPAPSPNPAPAPGPVPGIADGTYAVGKDIPPGVYASAGPLSGQVCYWRRVGPDDVTLNNAMSKQPQTVQILDTDLTFRTRGCQPWQPTDVPPPGETPPWLSQLQLRHNLDILNGLAGASGNGQLPSY